MDENSRKEMLSNYKELQKGLSETLAMQSENDEEVEALIREFQEQLQVLASALNESETIKVTPNLHRVESSSNSEFTNTAIVLPTPSAALKLPQELKLIEETDKGKDMHAKASSGPVAVSSGSAALECAAYEVFYDEKAWYPCVITQVIKPATALDRIQYRVHILGYNVEDIVFSESLRPWRATRIGTQLRSGVLCHAISPTSGLYKPAKVVRLTLDGTVIVIFTNDNTFAKEWSGESIGSNGNLSVDRKKENANCVEVEIPLSHVHVGKFYPILRKRPQLTEEEREARRIENAKRKRERIQMEKRMKEDFISQNANDWKAMMGNLMGMRPNKKRKY